MSRRYDSSRRQEAAQETRARILRVALKLHWEGVTEYEPLAREAGCSVPTVRKYFPTKEALFRSCTRAFAETLALPDLGALQRIDDPARRTEAGIAELCRIHESMFGYAWTSAHQRLNSPTLDEEMRAYEAIADAITEILTLEDPAQRSVLRGLLDFLTYRALRTSGGLAPEHVRKALIAIALPLSTANASFAPTTPTDTDAEP